MRVSYDFNIVVTLFNHLSSLEQKLPLKGSSYNYTIFLNNSYIYFAWYNYFMASGESLNYDLPYPVGADPVNVHGDIRQLVEQLETVLPPLGVGYFQIPVINNSGVDLGAGDPVYTTGFTTKTTIAKATSSTVIPILGLLKTDLANGSDGIVVVAGVLENINTSSFSVGDILYVAESGGLTNSRPEGGSGAVGMVTSSAAEGTIIVEPKGNGTWGALKAGLA